jgi:uncharacterized protein (TIGR00297 family)
MVSTEHLVIAVFIALVAFSFVLYVYLKRKITTSAFIGTTVVGLLILVTVGYVGVLALIAFFLFGNLVTKYKYERKAMLGVAEGNKGMRDINNVIGNGLAPVIFALSYAVSRDTLFLLGFSGAVATACADTFSTEIGEAEGNPRLITTFNKVPVGTNGGISLPGLGASLLGSFIISIVCLVFWFDLHLSSGTVVLLLSICILSGFLGCLVDSVFGATVEDKDPLRLNKHHVNISATLFGGIFALIFGYSLVV